MKRLLRKVLTMASRSPWVPTRQQIPILRLLGVKIGDDVVLMSGFHVAHGHRLHIADRVFINHGCYFDTQGVITIEDDVQIADHVRLITSTHLMGPNSRRAGASAANPIVIGRGSWIGTGVTILGGVTVGAGCMVAAGAVVTRDCDPDGLYAGVPARRLREL